MWSASQFLHEALSSATSSSSSSSSLLLLVCALVAGWYLFAPSKQIRALKSMPRPLSTLPILGNTLDLMFKQRDRFHDWTVDECVRQKGKPWLLTAIGRPASIVLSNAAVFEDVLQKQFKIFEKGPAGRMIAKDMFGGGIFGVDGVQWLHQRKTASHLFSLQMMRDIMEKVIVEETSVLCDLLDDACASPDKPVELKELVDRLSTEIFVRIGFGIKLGCLQNKQEGEFLEFFKAFSHCPVVIHSRIHQPMWLWRLKRFLNVGLEKQLKKDMKLVNDKIYEMIERSMANKVASNNAHDTPPQKDLISLFIANEGSEYKDSDDKTVRVETTSQLIRDVAFNFIGAGRGTTAHTFSWFFVMMNRYPDVKKKVRAELQAQLPELCSGAKRSATMEDVQKLVYLEAAIKESLRLNPPAPTNARTANQDTTLSDGTFLRAGTRVILPTYAASRMTWIWGEDACEFKPERWIDPVTGKILAMSPYKFLVFHAGPRLCLGIKLAMMELKIVLATMMSRYDITTLRDPFEITYATSISLPIKGSVFVTVEHADTPAAVKSPATVMAGVGAS
ncbi:Cytochrome p450 [Globisporangium polare]